LTDKKPLCLIVVIDKAPAQHYPVRINQPYQSQSRIKRQNMRLNLLSLVSSVAVATIAAPTFQPLPARDINLDAAGPGDGNKPGLYDSKAL
jgi:hypothetical protein